MIIIKNERICNDIEYTLIELVKTPLSNILDIEYIMVVIFIGYMTITILIENCNVKVKFMKKSNQGDEYYTWPHKYDLCWIPCQDIIIIIINSPYIVISHLYKFNITDYIRKVSFI